MRTIGLNHDDMSGSKNKEAALELLITRLEANQVLVSLSQRTAMPQQLRVKFGGLTIRDNKVPYVFLASDTAGRRIFTLTLLTVLVARKVFVPVTYDARTAGHTDTRDHDIVGEILMPSSKVREVNPASLDELKTAAEMFKVTPSAMTVRAKRLGLFGFDVMNSYLDELDREDNARAKPSGRTPHITTAVRKYSGRELSIRMLNALDAGKLSRGEFARAVCLNKIKPHEIGAFRAVLH